MRLFAIIVVFSLLFGCSRFPESTPGKNAREAREEEQYKKELDEVRKAIRGEVKIKLRRDAKGDYNWEITGKDANEVLKANDALAKKLGR
jgi:Sec-independent protein translocase protein TatA